VIRACGRIIECGFCPFCQPFKDVLAKTSALAEASEEDRTMRRNITDIGASLAVAAIASFYGCAFVRNAGGETATSVRSETALMDFPEGTATSSELCGSCHRTIYREISEGFGSDLHWADMQNYLSTDRAVAILEGVARGTSRSATAHFAAGTDPWPLDAMRVEEGGKQCNVCHYPQPIQYPDISAIKIEKPTPRSASQERGVTCASCHLTPDGKIRGPYELDAPHATVKDDRIRTSVACASCHSVGERVVGKQTQTFLEWREDFYKAGLGPQHCQDCHMPKTIRKLAESFDVPERVAARHLLSGGHSFQRIASALTLAVEQAGQDKPALRFQITNVGVGHSVPTGSNRRAVYLSADIIDANARVVANKEWMFAPWFGDRPDDKAFVDADKKGPEPIAATQADEQGPHETIIRAGEQRVLDWSPKLSPGRYSVRARLIYDLNRYNDRAFKDDQREIAQNVLEITVAGSQ
jgi:hypothetical protein